ncbi:MAG: 8-amino-7-oxononanoate synthase [Pirellulales bacterium]
MLTPSLAWIADELVALERAGLRRELVAHEGPQAATIAIGGTPLINFSSNDYLGLANDARLTTAAARAADECGWGAGASPLVTGRSTWHARLEARLAAWEGAEAALVFPSGFAANAGTIPALVGEGDAIFGDAHNHASLIDGCRLAKAERFIYRHADAAHLAELLDATRVQFRRRLIVTDTVFSMDGDLAPLPQIAKLATEHEAMLLVDEAHATGVWGEHGRGVVEHFAASEPDVERAVAVRMGTLSKALGSAGGFVCGGQMLIDWLANRARTYVFSTAAPAATAAAALAALEIVENEPQNRRDLLTRAEELRRRLAEAGWNVGCSQSQIIPLIVGDPRRAVALSSRLRERGLLVPAIRPPTVPEGQSLLRISLCHHHGPGMVETLLNALRDGI